MSIKNLSRISWQTWWLVAILAVAIFTRLYNLWGALQFQGDQGRDAMIVSQIFLEPKLVFIGPVTSVGNMYLGPLYYYFMLPFLALTYPSPTGPAFAIAGLGILTIYLVYRLGKELVGETAALFAATLYTLSATIALFARFSWNPNPAPFVSLLTIYFISKAVRQSGWYWAIVGLGISILLQLHYITLLAAAAAGGVWVWQLSRLTWQARQTAHPFKNWLTQTRSLWQGTALAAVIFLVSLTPLMLFDWKHQWLNARSFQALVFRDHTFEAEGTPHGLARVWTVIKEMDGRSMHIFFEYNIGKLRDLNRGLVWVVIGIVTWLLCFKRKYEHRSGLILLSWFLLVGVIGTATYQHTVFDHYIAYLFPVATLILGVVLAEVSKLKVTVLPLGLLASAVAVLSFAAYNLPRMPLQTMGWTVDEIQQTSQTILDRVKPGEKYNLVLLSESHDLDGQNYRYFLTTDRQKQPVPPEERGNVETLFIINEEKKTKAVTELPIYEIVTFPDKTPVETYQIPDGPEITVLKRIVK